MKDEIMMKYVSNCLEEMSPIILDTVETAYRVGCNDGYLEGLDNNSKAHANNEKEEAYDAGLKDMLVMIKRILKYEGVGGFSPEEIEDIFGHEYSVKMDNFVNIFTYMEDEEIIYRVKKYIEKLNQEEDTVDASIKIHDTVINKHGTQAIVIGINDDDYTVVWYGNESKEYHIDTWNASDIIYLKGGINGGITNE